METTTEKTDSGTSSEQSTDSAIPNIAANAAQKFVVPEKRKRGRPPGKANSSAPSPVNRAESVSAKKFEVDGELIRKVVSSGLKTVDAVLNRNLTALARLAQFDNEQGREIVDSAKMLPEENATISELSGVLAEKHGILGQYAPEFLWVVAVGGYAARQIGTSLQLRGLIKQIAKQRELMASQSANAAKRE